jgi:Amt family ammonium transporter
LIGIVSAIVYTAIVTFLILKLTEVLVGNRVDEEDEQEGLDLVAHNERGYDL